MCGIAGLALARDAPPPEPENPGENAARARPSRPGRHRGRHRRPGGPRPPAPRRHRRCRRHPAAASRATPSWWPTPKSTISRKSAPSCRRRNSPPTATANPRCTSGATAAPPSPRRYAACTPWRSTTAASACLTLCRDPFGIKPLYTAKIAGGIAFASEPQALLAGGLAAATFSRKPAPKCCKCSFPSAAAPSSPISSACSPAS